ncbi:MAG: hypothetical protein ACKVLD_07405, partial [Flavobacteriales bacterium]
MFQPFKGFYWILFILLFPIAVFSQASKYHYIPPLSVDGTSGSNAATFRGQKMYLSTPSNAPVNYTIWPLPLNNATKITGTIDKLSPTETLVNNTDYYIIPNGSGDGVFSQLFVSSENAGTVTSTKGYYIEADAPIYVSIRYNIVNQSSGFVSKGEAGLGKSFRTGGFTNGNPTDANYLNFASVMAVEAGTTTVTFSDINNNAGDGYADMENIAEVYDGSGNIADIEITLNQFETFVVATRV